MPQAAACASFDVMSAMAATQLTMTPIASSWIFLKELMGVPVDCRSTNEAYQKRMSQRNEPLSR
jgi:hypothetical protein